MIHGIEFVSWKTGVLNRICGNAGHILGNGGIRFERIRLGLDIVVGSQCSHGYIGTGADKSYEPGSQ